MSDELSPEARTLLEAGRAADLPGAEDRARVSARLALMLAGTAAGSAAGKAAAQASIGSKLGASALAGKAALAFAVLGAVAAGATLVLRAPDAPTTVAPQRAGSEAKPTATMPAQLQTSSSSANTAPSVASVEPQRARLEAPAPVAAPTRADRSAARVADQDWAADLQAEVALLSLAQRALAAGNPDAALDHLAQHRAQFPKGALSQERRAAAAIAHCQAGRLARGRDLLTGLPDDSPLSARAVEACRGTPR